MKRENNSVSRLLQRLCSLEQLLVGMPVPVLVILAGYAVVAVFILTFWIVKRISPELPLWAVFTFAVTVAAPPLLALVWKRLVSVKVFGVEVSLSEATVPIEAKVSEALSSRQYFSGDQSIIDQINATIVKPEIELIEVNLHATPYWWSTRLYLLSALLDDYSQVRRLVFVEGDDKRTYVGMAKPSILREALRKEFPDFEKKYSELNHNAAKIAIRAEQVGVLVNQWSQARFKVGKKIFNEKDRKCYVDSALLSKWLAKAGFTLDTDYIAWSDDTDSPLLANMIIRQRAKYIPLIKNRGLERVVNRFAFATRIAKKALSRA